MDASTSAVGRRAVLAATALVITLAVSVVVAGCGTGKRPASGATSDGAAVGTVVMVIRHGEKPDGVNPGIDGNGQPDDSSLTATGWDRARRLVDLFAPVSGPPRPGLSRPTAIFAARANSDGDGTRTRETVQPLAAKLGIATDTSFGKGDEAALVAHVMAQPGPTLISWQHGEIPAIAAAFPSVTPTPPSAWPADRFDVVWTFTRTADGWHFAQVPELALPQDQSAGIEN
jgi:broad specificity phosphatase PhoE